MNSLNKIVIALIVVVSGCTLGDNLDRRYTQETPVSAHVNNSDICLSLPLQSDEAVVSAITYNLEKPSEQFIFPSSKQAKSGLFCIQPDEFKFKSGQEYLTQIEVNKSADSENKKATRKAYVSTFRVVEKGDKLSIIQTRHK